MLAASSRMNTTRGVKFPRSCAALFLALNRRPVFSTECYVIEVYDSTSSRSTPESRSFPRSFDDEVIADTAGDIAEKTPIRVFKRGLLVRGLPENYRSRASNEEIRPNRAIKRFYRGTWTLLQRFLKFVFTLSRV